MKTTQCDDFYEQVNQLGGRNAQQCYTSSLLGFKSAIEILLRANDPHLNELKNLNFVVSIMHTRINDELDSLMVSKLKQNCIKYFLENFEPKLTTLVCPQALSKVCEENFSCQDLTRLLVNLKSQMNFEIKPILLFGDKENHRVSFDNYFIFLLKSCEAILEVRRETQKETAKMLIKFLDLLCDFRDEEINDYFCSKLARDLLNDVYFL